MIPPISSRGMNTAISEMLIEKHREPDLLRPLLASTPVYGVRALPPGASRCSPSPRSHRPPRIRVAIASAISDRLSSEKPQQVHHRTRADQRSPAQRTAWHQSSHVQAPAEKTEHHHESQGATEIISVTRRCPVHRRTDRQSCGRAMMIDLHPLSAQWLEAEGISRLHCCRRSLMMFAPEDLNTKDQHVYRRLPVQKARLSGSSRLPNPSTSATSRMQTDPLTRGRSRDHPTTSDLYASAFETLIASPEYSNRSSVPVRYLHPWPCSRSETALHLLLPPAG